jgi:hypothetical protein
MHCNAGANSGQRCHPLDGPNSSQLLGLFSHEPFYILKELRTPVNGRLQPEVAKR